MFLLTIWKLSLGLPYNPSSNNWDEDDFVHQHTENDHKIISVRHWNHSDLSNLVSREFPLYKWLLGCIFDDVISTTNDTVLSDASMSVTFFHHYQ